MSVREQLLMTAMERAQKAIVEVRRIIGPPGEYGYSTAKGKALCELYDSCNAMAKARPALESEVAL